MILYYILAGVILMWVLRGLWPVTSLRYVNIHELEETTLNHSSVKILDVRDASDYLQRHVPGSINISLGRLPYVWHKELSGNDTVVILSESFYHSNKAARILHKRGFRHLYAINGNAFHEACQQSKAKGCGIYGHRIDY